MEERKLSAGEGGRGATTGRVRVANGPALGGTGGEDGRGGAAEDRGATTVLP
jgi:hypothetical protein